MNNAEEMKNENNHRIETKASGTANIMCLARAASYKDKWQYDESPSIWTGQYFYIIVVC
jgi:hypothetical protein